jgi:hypothetical protein
VNRLRRLAAAFVSVVVISQMTVAPAFAVNWPIPMVWMPVNNRYDPQPWMHSNGVNLWCPIAQAGTYGNSFIVQPQTWVNYGSTCNGQWPQPAGRLRATAISYRSNGVVIATSTQTNPANTWTVTAAVSYSGIATAYVASATISDQSNAYQFSRCWGVCGI